LLGQTLEQLTRVVDPGVPWEVIVVNNNSTDATDAIIAAFATRLPIRGIVEPRAGLSNARNRAVDEACGEYIVFTDDDVLVEPEWLVAYDAAFRRYPDAGQFGGPIDPWFEGAPPDWLRESFSLIGPAFAAIDHGRDPRRLDDDHPAFGANIAARTAVLRQYRFDPSLGRTGNNMLSGEETTLFAAMRRDGVIGWWVPGARVRHFVPRHRQTLAYLRKWCTGVGWYQGMAPPRPDERVLLGVPFWVWRQLVEGPPRFCVNRAFAPAVKWVGDMSRVASAWGYLRGRRASRRHHPF
jgi:glycosyltransferase involved in cell wall biosynthesis